MGRFRKVPQCVNKDGGVHAKEKVVIIYLAILTHVTPGTQKTVTTRACATGRFPRGEGAAPERLTLLLLSSQIARL